MKFFQQISLLSFFCLMWAGAIGQSVVHVSGDVTDDNGNPIPNTYVTMWTQTDPAWAFNFDVPTDVNGHYDIVFTVNMSQGEFTISYACNNSLISYNHFFFPNANIVQDFNCGYPAGGCAATIWSNASNGAINLEVSLQGTGPYTYQWSNGATTATIPPPFFGSACVTVTDATGCVATDCFPDSNNICMVTILETAAGGLVASPSANAVTYLWSTGQTGATIFPPAPGTYCVTATYADGCTATDCYTFDSNGNPDPCNNAYISVSPVPGTIGVNACVSVFNPATNYSYVWSTGATSGCIFVAQDGVYCVTLTDADGNSCEICSVITIPVIGDCGVQIGPDSSGSNQITAYPFGQAPFAYLWSNGATTATIGMNANTTYCVTVTDATGCEATSCYTNGNTGNCVVEVVALNSSANIHLLYTVSPINMPIISWLWSTGETTEQITVTNDGEYCVTVTYANGCEATSCIIIPQLNDCVTEVGFYNGTPSLIANVTNGVAPFTYLWNTGEASQTIQLTTEGVYCCTVTDANGCISSDCFWYDPNGNNNPCGVEIAVTPFSDGSWQLTAYGTGEAPFSYVWSTGETSAVIQYNGDPTLPVCVSLVDSTGCSVTTCATLDPVTNLGNISGSIFPLTNTAQQTGLVYLIEVTQTNNGIYLTAVDTVAFSQNPNGLASYSFTNVEDGCYLIKAALDFGSIGYEGLLPTYYGDVMFWNEASYVCVPNFLNIQFDINLIPGNNPGGPGFIGGYVNEGAGFHQEVDEERGPGDPVANVIVIITDMADTPVAYTYTAADGSYGIGNLAWGTYKVWAEIAGLEPIFVIVTIGPDAPAAENVNFELTTEGLTGTDIPESISAVSLYPNPVSDVLYLVINSEKAGVIRCTVSDLAGKNIFSQTNAAGAGETVIQIPADKWSSGMYLLNITDDKQMISRKFVKK